MTNSGHIVLRPLGVVLNKLISFFNAEQFNFNPYSLRRGGETFLLQEGLALESILVRGRWKFKALLLGASI